MKSLWARMDDVKTDDVCMMFARIQVCLALGAVGFNEHGSHAGYVIC